MTYDLFCIGNALMDLEFLINEEFLDIHQLTKGTMHLIDLRTAMELRSQLPSQAIKQQCGGSAANTALAAHAFGCKVFFGGKVANDDYGVLFNREFNEVGIATHACTVSATQESTGHCIVLITEDAERTMNTCLSISNSLAPADLEEQTISDSRHVYLEGYLASSDTGHLAATRTRELAEANHRHVSITLSDVSMVTAFRPNLETILGNGVDRLFCNLEEGLAWCGTDRVELAINELRDVARVPVITLGKDGCIVGSVRSGREVKGFPVMAKDVNGAGDMFAGSYLAAIAQGSNEFDAARFGNYAASRVVQKIGSRLDSVADYHATLVDYRSSVNGT